MSWPINRCPLSTQQCTVLFLDKKREKIRTQAWRSKIKQDIEVKKASRSAPPLILSVSPKQPFGLFPLINVSPNKKKKEKKKFSGPSWNHCGERKALLNKHDGVKYLICFALPRGQGYGSLQMTSRVKGEAVHA